METDKKVGSGFDCLSPHGCNGKTKRRSALTATATATTSTAATVLADRHGKNLAGPTSTDSQTCRHLGGSRECDGETDEHRNDRILHGFHLRKR